VTASSPRAWRLLSTVLLVVAIVGIVLGDAWGWWALILSGVTFVVERVLLRRERDGAGRSRAA
jgi:hypothetical protein